MFDIIILARLNVLLGAVQVIVMSSYSFDRSKHLMLAFKNEISMDLITYNGHAILHAEIADRRQLLFRPDSSDRVVRIAEEKSFTFFSFQLLLRNPRHIHVIAVIIAEHRVLLTTLLPLSAMTSENG